MVLASAGSGKTYQLGNRMIGFVAMGIDPATMVALTFTRKAAGEFTDAVLTKIARACLDSAQADAIEADLNNSGRSLEAICFPEILERIVLALPRMTLGTMDGFFTKVVKAFPYELGISSGNFQLVEGAQWQLLQESLLQSILLNDLAEKDATAFFQSFRKSLMGRENFRVREQLEDYVSEWHRSWRQCAEHVTWGPDQLAEGGSVAEWNQRRDDYATQIIAAFELITPTHASQPTAWKKMAELIAEHSTGSGVIGGKNTLLERILELVAVGAVGDSVVKANKDMIIPAKVMSLLQETLLCAARAEIASACELTRAVREVIVLFDQVCERQLRRKGLFNFDDVKVLMSAWSRQEDQRLLRESLDFRLHSQYGHWLLDEFQDTSRADWAGLFPLADEAATDDDGSLFIVGDKKQAIYGWRGGDVRLFDEVRARYDNQMHIETMPESYRSASEVLELVNQVCGNIDTISQLYPGAAQRWEWEDHISAKPDLRGHTRVESIEEKEESGRLERMVELLHEIGIGKKQLSCGVLVRTNKEMLEVSDYLREAGFRVIEDGVRKPAHDNPIGVTLWQLFRWLANPSDLFALETIKMSPLWQQLTTTFGEYPWTAAHRAIHHHGFAGLAEMLLEPRWAEFSAFGKNRSLDLLEALSELDLRGNATAAMAASILEKLEVSQSPGAAHIQVMTIHKSKGLGFDVVFLPLISRDKIPHAGKFTIAEGANWICKTPPNWARKLSAPLAAAQADWEQQQQYEAMCLLYVALTRAKRGLYLLLEEKKRTSGEGNSHAEWIKDSCPGESPVLFESGSFTCYDDIPFRRETPSIIEEPTLGPAVIRGVNHSASKSAATDHGGLTFGTKIHAILESINWLDDPNHNMTDPYFHQPFAASAVRNLLEKRQRSVELQKELPVEGLVAEQWTRGVIDRLHLFRDLQGKVIAAEIIDFKTDKLNDATLLRAAHESQLDIYRQLCAQALKIDASQISCHLIGLHAGLVSSW